MKLLITIVLALLSVFTAAEAELINEETRYGGDDASWAIMRYGQIQDWEIIWSDDNKPTHHFIVRVDEQLYIQPNEYVEPGVYTCTAITDLNYLEYSCEH
ncbi:MULTISPECIES: hypothetical protein [unclassified Roseobacter]|uniref:hypothetical protein n=1 Tax=unclassified Roseobacter TaxID=196798 RepID=UPI0030EE2705